MTKRVSIPAQVNEFLETHTRTVMFTLRKDGSPTGHPMSAFVGEGLYLNMYRASIKSHNLQRDDRICCLVTTPTEAPRFKGVLYKGRARAVPVEEAFSAQAPRGLERARNAGSRAGTPGSTEAERRAAHAGERTRQGIRVVYDIVPERVGLLDELRGE